MSFSGSYHTFPRSAIVPQAPGTYLPRGAPAPPPRMPTLQPSTRHHHSNKLTRHHPHSVSAAPSRHVHYEDELSQPRSRTVSGQSSGVRGLAQAFPAATTSRHLHPTVTQQPPQGQRRRAHSTGGATAPGVFTYTPSQSQQQARASSGHEYSRCTGRKKALCVSK